MIVNVFTSDDLRRNIGSGWVHRFQYSRTSVPAPLRAVVNENECISWCRAPTGGHGVGG